MSKPAFPKGAWSSESQDDYYDAPQTGMSLLEYYAGQALISGVYEAYKEGVPGAYEEIARDAFSIAQAMVKESERRSK